MADLGALLGSLGVGGVIGQAIVKLELDSAKYSAELKAAHAETATGTSKLGSSFAALGGVAKAGLAAGALAVVAFGANAVRAASDLGEAVNKSNVIFGANAREIEAWAETGAEAFGLSKTAALDAAGGFGSMLQTAGVAVAESAKMSTSLVQLAGDMASFNNIDPTEALEKLRSGLAGEAEPLRRFGVFLSESAVQQEAYRSGIAKIGDELTEAQKVQARYNIIFEQTTKQQGDFARTADSLPNQLRTMKAEFENVSAEVGEELLPVAVEFMGLVKELIPVLGLLADVLKPLVQLLSDVASALTLSSNGFDSYLQRLNALAAEYRAGNITIGEFNTKLVQLREETGFNLNVSDEYVAKLEEFRTAQWEATRTAEGLKMSMTSAREGFTQTADAADEAGKSVRHFAHMSTEELKDWKSSTKESFDDYTFNVSQVDNVTRQAFRESFREFRENARELSRAMDTLSKEHWVNDDFIVFLSDLGPQWLIQFANLNEEKQRKYQESWEHSTEKQDKAKESLDKITNALDDMGKKTTKHTVEVHYKYVDFDPSKPGMGDTRPSSLTGAGVRERP